MIKKIAESVIIFALNWASGYFVSYFDKNKDDKVSAEEIKDKLNPNAKKLIRLLK